MITENTPLFVWSVLITAALLQLAHPVLAGGIQYYFLINILRLLFFDPGGGGFPVLCQHLSCFFGFSEIYILILLEFRIVPQIIMHYRGKHLTFGHLWIVYAISTIGLLGFIVWAHHMFTVGIGLDTRAYFTAATVIIAISTGIEVSGWLRTVFGGRVLFNAALWWTTGFIFRFTLGGLTSIVLPTSRIDIALHDTY